MEPTMDVMPWRDWTEWQHVRLGLFSDSPGCRQYAVDRVAIWRQRGVELPVAINLTSDLMELELSSASCSPRARQLALATTVLRAVNGLVDTYQNKGLYAQPIATIATQELGLPLYLVDLRHDIAHNRLPSLAVLELGAETLLTWVSTEYWTRQSRALESHVERVQTQKPSGWTVVEVQDLVIPLLLDEHRYGVKCSFVNVHDWTQMQSLFERLVSTWSEFNARMLERLVQHLVQNKNNNMNDVRQDRFIRWLHYFCTKMHEQPSMMDVPWIEDRETEERVIELLLPSCESSAFARAICRMLQARKRRSPRTPPHGTTSVVGHWKVIPASSSSTCTRSSRELDLNRHRIAFEIEILDDQNQCHATYCSGPTPDLVKEEKIEEELECPSSSSISDTEEETKAKISSRPLHESIEIWS